MHGPSPHLFISLSHQQIRQMIFQHVGMQRVDWRQVDWTVSRLGRNLFHHDFRRAYSPRNSVLHVAPLSVDFSQDCSTVSAFTRTILIRFSTASPLEPRLGPRNSAVPAETF